MKTLRYLITGIAPLLMHSDQTANPLNKFTKQLKQVTSKRAKTDEDHQLIAQIEFEASLYHNATLGYYVPSANLDATFLASAKQFKLGTTYKQAILIPDDSKLRFKHEKLAPADLFDLNIYTDQRTVKVQTAKNIRTRPIFDQWSLEVTLFVDESKMNEHQVDEIVENAGRYVGVCDFRPRFGRFKIEKI